MASKQAKSNLSVLCVFLGVILVVIGIAFVERHRLVGYDDDGESVEMDEESYLEREREWESEGQKQRQSIFDPPGYEWRVIKEKLPWTWSTCGLKNTSAEIDRAERDEGRVWPDNSHPVHRGQFPWYLIIFNGERDENLKENNGWVDHSHDGCGASLISGHHGLTAAHCYCDDIASQPNKPDQKRKSYVAAGLKNIHELTEPTFAPAWRLLSNCVKHPEYKSQLSLEANLDIAILTWDGPSYQFTTNERGIIVINTACVSLPVTIYYGTRMEFVGNGRNKGYYRWFPWTYTFWLYCHGKAKWPHRHEVVYCRANRARDGAICHGDSGGPLTSALHPREPNRWYQTGVLSNWHIVEGDVFEDCRNGLSLTYTRPDILFDFVNHHVHD